MEEERRPPFQVIASADSLWHERLLTHGGCLLPRGYLSVRGWTESQLAGDMTLRWLLS
jgi:hypothetical protein